MTTTRSPETSNDDDSMDKIQPSIYYINQTNFAFCGYCLKIARNTSANLGVSAYVWDAGVALCRYFEKENISFTGKKVIELGSGTGIVGILATLLGGNVTLTDQPNALQQIEHNIATNIPAACRHRINIRPLIWGEDHIRFTNEYDFILGSDLVYSSASYSSLIRTLHYLAHSDTTIYLASAFRKGNGSLSFHDVLLPVYFKCMVVDRLADKDITVYKMTKIGRGPEDWFLT
ncbi:EEF1A lysine methyltransferase 3-like [Rhincodon typus]|uniref:EEF1A lysine methyltransferase 3-like n=1 Tax=Rhincodon typus TaxID=259920 RepID=UPI0009A3E9DE|nr:EEF1A lysine methyltransferase 3-like [Rhincodon typus]